RPEARRPVPLPGVLAPDQRGDAPRLRRLFVQGDPRGRRACGRRPRGLPVPGREHPPLPRPAPVRRDDRGRRSPAGGLHQLHRRRGRAARRLGGLSSVSAFVRLVGAGWTLVRNDALLPRELSALYPGWLDTLSKTLNVFARRDARTGRPGERLA